VQLWRALDDGWSTFGVLHRLGDAYLTVDDPAAARRVWAAAAAITVAATHEDRATLEQKLAELGVSSTEHNGQWPGIVAAGPLSHQRQGLVQVTGGVDDAPLTRNP
jgi:hypothetical protein